MAGPFLRWAAGVGLALAAGAVPLAGQTPARDAPVQRATPAGGDQRNEPTRTQAAVPAVVERRLVRHAGNPDRWPGLGGLRKSWRWTNRGYQRAAAKRRAVRRERARRR